MCSYISYELRSFINTILVYNFDYLVKLSKRVHSKYIETRNFTKCTTITMYKALEYLVIRS